MAHLPTLILHALRRFCFWRFVSFQRLLPRFCPSLLILPLLLGCDAEPAPPLETRVAERIFATQTSQGVINASANLPAATPRPSLLPGTPSPPSSPPPTAPPGARTPAPTPTLAGAPLAATLKAVVLTHGTQGAGLEPQDETSWFPSNQRVLHCVLTLKDAPVGTQLRAVWWYTQVEGYRPNSMIDDAYATVTGSANVDLSLSSRQDWPPGSYRVEVYMNDQLVRTLPFLVK